MKSVNLLIKPASSLCNLRCRYCFYEDEARNRTQRSMGVMSQALAQQLICQAFDAVDAGGAVNFTFQGGEPTVAGLPFFRDFAQTARTHCPAGVSVHYAIQTNGTLLDEQWAAFLKQEHFLVGLSLDGMRRVHDSLRLDAAGSGTWQRVLAAKSLLEKYGVDYNALCVVTADCARRGEQVYKNLKNLGFRYIQFIACMDPIGRPRGQEPWSLTPEEYGVFLCRIFDLWYQDWKKRDYHSIRLFDDYIHILLGDGASTCATCGKCGSYLVIEGDGSAYPCDFYVLDPWKLGSIQETTIARLSGSEKAAAFLRWGTDKPAECRSCPYGRLCNGGCKNDWHTDETGTHNYFCSSFRTLLDYALPRMQEIAAAEHAARHCQLR